MPNEGIFSSAKRLVSQVNETCAVAAAYIFGSVALDDYRHGWSDIDIIILAERPLSAEQAEKLINLRSTDPSDEYLRKFEGGIVDVDSFVNRVDSTAVYWGTSGQRARSDFRLDPFSMVELIEKGILIYGADIRGRLKRPSGADIYRAIKHHYKTIREVAQVTDASLYSYGWMLDISRCLYTLEYGKIISKTDAGQWALDNEFCSHTEVLKRVLTIRKFPVLADENDEREMGPYVQKYANVLERALMILTFPAEKGDVDEWIELVLSMKECYPGLDIDDYRRTLLRNIERGSAICVKIMGRIAGVLMFSVEQMCLSFLAVLPEFRRIGVASALIRRMLWDMPTGEISVTTYREGDPMGVETRNLYIKNGFKPGELTREFDYPLQIFTIHNEKKELF